MDDIDGDERGGRGLGREIMLVVEVVKRVISYKFKRSVNILFKDENSLEHIGRIFFHFPSLSFQTLSIRSTRLESC